MSTGLVLSTGRLKGDCPVKPSFQQGSRLDHFFMDVTLLGRAVDSWVDDGRFDSDHFPVVLRITIPEPSQPAPGSSPLPFVRWDASKAGDYGRVFPSLQQELDSCQELVSEGRLDPFVHWEIF
ncbi:hypothetical protein WJX84_002976 [Apatococcus fuscideae]|uniref:Endonuclease/exonuclease/phosphatase domain-containing protein n=1 Tax=Apatococcus fuscideae TaxID=2026836 RepID=A0AAW1RQV3_9CHLO